MGRPAMLAECFVNQAILAWLARRGVPLHCNGVNDCIRKLGKKLERHREGRHVILIDYEESPAQRKIVDRSLQRYRCAEKCRAGTISAYSCLEGRVVLILFMGPPEGLLARASVEHTKKFRDPRSLREFKRRADEYVRVKPPPSCEKAGDWVLRGLCILYRHILEEAGECLEGLLGSPG